MSLFGGGLRMCFVKTVQALQLDAFKKKAKVYIYIYIKELSTLYKEYKEATYKKRTES